MNETRDRDPPEAAHRLLRASERVLRARRRAGELLRRRRRPLRESADVGSRGRSRASAARRRRDSWSELHERLHAFVARRVPDRVRRRRPGAGDHAPPVHAHRPAARPATPRRLGLPDRPQRDRRLLARPGRRAASCCSTASSSERLAAIPEPETVTTRRSSAARSRPAWRRWSSGWPSPTARRSALTDLGSHTQAETAAANSVSPCRG